MKKPFLILVVLLLVSMVSMVWMSPVGGDPITITAVTLRLRTWQSTGGNDQLYIYLYDGSIWSSAYTVTPSTSVGSYREIGVFSFLDTAAKIDVAQMRIEKITVDSANTVYVDHAQLRISGLSGSTVDLNVDGRLVDASWDGWTRVGASPWLNASDYNTHYIYTSVSNEKIGNFTFQDVPELSVSPLSIMDDTKQPKPAQTIRPIADSASATFRDWTNNTLTVRPMAPEGTFTGLTGRILTLKPNDQGTYSEWSSWVHLIPNGEGNFSGWAGTYSGWDDWPTHDSDSTYQYANAHNQNETSDLFNPPATPRALPISKVRLTIVARDYPSDIDERVQMMLSSAIPANVSSFTEASGWAGWQRVGTNPWLNRTDYPSSYINTTTADKIGNFTFQTVPSTTGITWITPLQLVLKTWQSGGGGNDTLKIYLYDGTSWSAPYTVTPLTSVGSYRYIDVSSFLTSVTKINLAKMAIEKVTDANNVPDNVYVDYACIRLSGVRNTASDGVTTALTTAYASYTSEWATNPFTGSAWTWSDIDNLHAGVRSVMVGSWTVGTQLRVTQLYVSVLTGGLYTDWDEWPHDNSDTDYVAAAADAKRQSSALPDTASPPFPTIAKVQVSIVARVNETTDEEVQMMVGVPPFEVTANVDGFDNTLTGWTRVPPGTTGPWLATSDYPTNYIYTSAKEGIGAFSFQNIAGGTTWNTVKLRIKTWQSGGSNNDLLKIELNDGTSWGWTTTVTPSITVGYYPDIDVSSFLNSEAKINAAKMRLTKDTSGSADTIYVDHAYLSLSRVYYGSPTTLSTSYLAYSSEWATSPATGLAWTWSDIDALQAGVKSKVGVIDPPTWTGELRVTQLYVKVIEAGTYQQWDEAPQDEDDTYNSAISGALSRSSQLTDHTSETWSIARVQVSVVARADIDLTTDERERMRIMLVIGGTRYNSSDFTPTIAYATYSYVWTTNPAGGSWDWTAIDNLQAGVSSVQYGAAWKGEIRVTQLYVVVCRSGTYAQWDEVTQNGDTDYVSATMKDMQESSQLQNPTHQSWDIARVRVVFYARVTEATDEKVQPMLVIGGEAWAGSESEKYTLTTNYVKYTGDWGKNPSTDDYWTWDEIDALEAGVKSIESDDKLWTGEIRVTQLYVEVAGPRFMVYVQVDDVTNLYTYEFYLNYTADVFTAASISLGGWFPYDSVIYKNEINDTAGYAHYSVTMPYGSPSGLTTTEPKLLANVTFFPDSYGESSLDLWYTDLRNPAAGKIAHDVYDGYFNNMILGDINRDKTVTKDDLSVFSGVYGSQSSWDQGDFNRDGKSDVSDLFDLGKNYGESI